MRKVEQIRVFWDTSGDSSGDDITPQDIGLPEIVNLPDSICEHEISDWLSDFFGFCHFGYERVGNND